MGGVVLVGVSVGGVCALQRPQERRQYGPLVMKDSPHFPNWACSGGKFSSAAELDG